MALLAKSLSGQDGLNHRLVSTGQHADLVENALSIFGAKPDVNLNVMKPGQSLSKLSSQLFRELGDLFDKSPPDLVIVHGDTTSALVSTMSAFYEGIPVAHIEAGLRSGSLADPFPEEYNRRSIDQLSDLCFAPTEMNSGNLLREDKPASSIFVVGNTVVDAVIHVQRRLDQDKALRGLVERELSESAVGLDIEKTFLLVTCHRRESFGEPLQRVLAALKEIAKQFSGVQIVFPVHPNPSVHDSVWRVLGDLPNVVLTPPLNYETMVLLISKCLCVMSDSGGLQEEAPTFGKRGLVLRDVTERQEGVSSGNLELVGTDKERIVVAASQLINGASGGEILSVRENPFGDGRSVSRITAHLLSKFSS